MKVLCLKSKEPVTVDTAIRDGRFCDRLIPTQGSGDNLEYVIEIPATGIRSPMVAVRILWDSDNLAKILPVFLNPELPLTNQFVLNRVVEENIEWLCVCLTIAQKQYSPWLKEQKIASARAKHWFVAGDFEPKQFDDIAWYTAVLWQKWRKQKFSWKECVTDLGRRLDFSLTGDSSATFDASVDRIRKLSGRLELKRDW